MASIEEIIKWHHSTVSGFARHYLLLYAVVLGLEAKKVLEFGSGLSSKSILGALGHSTGKLITIDMRSVEETGNSVADLKEYPNWTYLQGASGEVLRSLNEKGFDCVLHDGSHEWRTVFNDLRKVIPLMKKDGLIMIHDTEHPKINYHLLFAVRLALIFVRHEFVTLPYGHGLTVVRIKSNYGHGKISTTWKKTVQK
jgi:predicted O-methyltransferase YrrM